MRMNPLRWLVHWLAIRRLLQGRFKVIKDRRGVKDYLIRIFLYGSDTSTGFRLCVHVMLRSDEGGLHDHPWPFMSWVLVGGFYERLHHRIVWRGPGSVYFRGHHTFHRVELPGGSPACVTCVLMLPRLRFGRKAWGFITASGKWMYYQTYLHRLFGRSFDQEMMK